MKKSDALVEEIIMQMASDSGCHFEKITAKSIKRRETEKAEDVITTTIRVVAPDFQTLKGFTVMLGERADRIHQFVVEGAAIYTYEAFQRHIRAMIVNDIPTLTIFL